jgi:phage recombination protein Bet
MSNITTVANRDFDSKELQLIRDTVARGASADEFKLFLYRCKTMGLDPLKPGQIFFIKYGTAPGTIVIGREGFRVRASKTGKHTGTKLGTIRDDSGKCIGAWCEVFRSDWQHSARVEVSLAEYNTGKSQWAKMPETMIQKVAEAAALRMAFPDELGGIYLREEMDQAAPEERDVIPQSLIEEPTIEEQDSNPANFTISFGTKYKNMTIAEAIDRDGLPAFQNYLHWLENSASKQGKPLSVDAQFLKVNFGRMMNSPADSAYTLAKDPK